MDLTPKQQLFVGITTAIILGFLSWMMNWVYHSYGLYTGMIAAGILIAICVPLAFLLEAQDRKTRQKSDRTDE